MQRGRENNEEGYKGLRIRGEQLFHREKEGLYRGFIRATSSRNPWSLTRDFEIYARCRREVCDTISRPIYGFREKSWIAIFKRIRTLAPSLLSTKTSVSHSCVARDFMETHGAVIRAGRHQINFSPKLKLQLNCRSRLLPVYSRMCFVLLALRLITVKL